MEQQTLSTPEKPVLDEATFQQLLAAAYVLQEENPEPPKAPVSETASSSSETLSEIAETQELLRSQYVDLPAAANLVAERLQKITHAAGVAIALVRQDQLEYCAARGSTAELAGARIPVGSDLSTASLPEAEILQRLQSDSPGLSEPLREHGVYSLPLQHEGKVAGLLEIRFENTDRIQEQEIRTCQLMAGLMNEAIARAADLEWKQALAKERATMLEALERLKPQLERLAIEPPALEPAEPVSHFPGETAKAADPVPSKESVVEPASDAICRQCGRELGIGELFCGRCGTKRPVEVSPSGDLQSQWASLWRLQQTAARSESHDAQDHDNQYLATESEAPEAASDANPEAPILGELDREIVSALEQEMARLAAEEEPATEEPLAEESHILMATEDAPEAEAVIEPGGALVPAVPETQKTAWASATKTLKWLRSLEAKTASRTWLKQHRADLYVGASVILLLLALFSGWGSQPQSHTAARNAQPSLTLFEKMLVGMGLAEAPKAPVYLGNPNAQVWVDLRTALYYCPGSDLYGKTEGGKFTTQRDAQMDQFEPAARKSCD